MHVKIFRGIHNHEHQFIYILPFGFEGYWYG